MFKVIKILNDEDNGYTWDKNWKDFMVIPFKEEYFEQTDISKELLLLGNTTAK